MPMLLCSIQKLRNLCLSLRAHRVESIEPFGDPSMKPLSVVEKTLSFEFGIPRHSFFPIFIYVATLIIINHNISFYFTCLQTGKLLKESDKESGHKKTIQSLVKSADGSHFLTGSLDKSAKVSPSF
jgi:hypothetical protein